MRFLREDVSGQRYSSGKIGEVEGKNAASNDEG